MAKPSIVDASERPLNLGVEVDITRKRFWFSGAYFNLAAIVSAVAIGFLHVHITKGLALRA